jgi:threonine/homoserine/homoserine lactone efflux protein
MPITLLLAAAAGAACTLTPGPGFLALLGIGAAQGRRAGAGFILGRFAGDVVWSSLALPALLAAACVGFLGGDCVLIWIAGAAGVRRLYRRHEIWIVRGSGLLFLGFGAAALAGAMPGLRRALSR